MPKPFILNDENIYNSYGFRVVNDGIDLTRFKLNPVMLDGHYAENENVIGRWENLRFTDDGKLLADPIFDMEDEKAKKIAGKVERGFINACSMGLLFNPDNMLREANGKWMLAKSELFEDSIIPIPSNYGAIRLYVEKDGERHLMTEDEIKMCLSGVHVDKNFQNDNNTMKKIILSVASLVALGLDKTITNPSEGVDENVVNNAISNLKSRLDVSEQKLSAAELALKTLQDAATAQKRLSIEKKVDEAIAIGKLNAQTNIDGRVQDTRAEFIQMGINNEATLDAVLSALPAKQSLANQVNNPGATTGEIKTMDDFQKLSVEKQLSFKNEQPEAYRTLVASM